MGQLFQFVGTPVTKIQWPGRTYFERITAGNMLQVQLCTSPDEPFHRAHIPVDQIISLLFQPVKECGIFYQSYFDSFGNAASPIAFIQRSKKMSIIKYGSGWSE